MTEEKSEYKALRDVPSAKAHVISLIAKIELLRCELLITEATHANIISDVACLQHFIDMVEYLDE